MRLDMLQQTRNMLVLTVAVVACVILVTAFVITEGKMLPQCCGSWGGLKAAKITTAVQMMLTETIILLFTLWLFQIVQSVNILIVEMLVKF